MRFWDSEFPAGNFPQILRFFDACRFFASLRSVNFSEIQVDNELVIFPARVKELP